MKSMIPIPAYVAPIEPSTVVSLVAKNVSLFSPFIPTSAPTQLDATVSLLVEILPHSPLDIVLQKILLFKI